MPDTGFTEKGWHWWLSRVGIPVSVGILAASVAIYVAHYNKSSNTDQSGLPAATDPYAGGWGPERQVFTSANPSTYAVLDSITDSPALGDERDFVRVRRSDGAKFADSVHADIGDFLWASAWVMNDVTDSYANQSAATIHGLTAQLIVGPASTSIPFSITLEARNATSVWDGAIVLTNRKAHLSYVNGSAYILSADANHMELEDSGFDIEGKMVLGEFQQDGELPAGKAPNGQERSFWLYFQLRVDEAK